MDFLELTKRRYSLRKMNETKIPEDELNKILEAARLAPTAHNNQEQRLLVVTEEEQLEKVRKCTNCHFNANTIIVLSYEPNEAIENMEEYAKIDLGIIVAHMTLEATNLNIGSTIVALFDKERLKQELNIPENYTPLLLLPLGYPKDNAKPSHLHYQRKKLEEIVKYNKY